MVAPLFLASSPPTTTTTTGRSPAQPSGLARRYALSASARVPTADVPPRVDVASEDGSSTSRSRLSFSSSRAAAFFASAPPSSATAARPPAAPPSSAVFVGFNAPAAACGAPAAPPSPGKQAPRGLLSQALCASSPAPLPGSMRLLRTAAPPPPAVPLEPLLAVQARLPVFASPLVVAAYEFAARAHAGQARASGAPVLEHALATAVVLAELGLPEDLVAAGLLHDVLDDTAATSASLEEHLIPRRVVDLVERVSRLSALSQAYRDNAASIEAAAMLDMLTGMDDVGALLIKLADRLHNMRTIGALPRCTQVRVANETLDVFSVLANRLGAWSVKAELEDLAFGVLHAEEAAAVRAAIDARVAAAGDLSALVTAARDALGAAGVEAVDVSGRVKNAYGVWKKLRKARGSAVGAAALAAGASAALSSLDGGSGSPGALPPGALDALGVHDVLALRLVVPHKHDCYAALRAVTAAWAPMPGRTKDYVRKAKANGYQSLHATLKVPSASAAAASDSTTPSAVPLEVQIRTPKMHYIAEYGFAAHWAYKERSGLSEQRDDLWQARLVQWKKWVATEKLGVRDAKVRPGGSPGRDLALAALGLRAAGEAAEAGAAASASFDDGAGAAVADAMADDATGAFGSPADPFLRHERFRLRPISDDDVAARPVAVMLSGPRGARLAELPARATADDLLAGGVAAAVMPAGGADQRAAASAAAGGGAWRVRVNGAPAPVGGASLVLRAGDHVELLPPTAAPGVAAPPARVPSPAADPAIATPALAPAGSDLDIYLPGAAQPASVEQLLRRKLALSSSTLRASALAS